MKATVRIRPQAGPQTRLAILADDFTGANDTGVQFSKRGLSTAVSLDPSQLPSMLQRFTVLAVDTESRFASPELAYQAVCDAVSPIAGHGVQLLYKKIDSTVRGNLGGEISAVLDTTGATVAMVCPALPAYGRTVEDGNCLVNGVLIEETEFGRDPRTPVRTSRIADIIRRQCSYPVSEISLSIVRCGPQVLAAAIDAAAIAAAHGDGGPCIAIVDAVTDADLETIARSADLTTEPTLLTGSSGLAAHVALPDIRPAAVGTAANDGTAGERRNAVSGAYTTGRDTSEPNASEHHTSTGPDVAGILIAIGSASATAAEQIRRACADRPRLHELIVDPARALNDPAAELRRIVDQYLRCRHAGDPCLVRTKQPDQENALATDIAESLARFMGDLVRRLCHAAPPFALMLSGGDTAIKTAMSLGCAGFTIENEILPGIPLGRFIHSTAEGTPAGNFATLEHIRIVTKAGAFGPPDALLRILQYLEELET